MWDRKALKARGKAAFKANYWMAVLMAVILIIVSGGGTGAAAGSGGFNVNLHLDESDTQNVEVFHVGDAISDIAEDPSAVIGSIGEAVKAEIDSGALAGIAVVLFFIFGIAVAASLVLTILLFNPLQVGCQLFFIRNSDGQGAMGNIGRAFKPNWRGNVKTMFLRDLFQFLWGLLFIVPGIIKAYSYRMVPYILADHPEMSGTEVITLSRQMMDGNKWRTFVLDLSFVGWHILSGLTLGILGIFYVNPYQFSTNAELYQALKNQIEE